MILQWVKGHFLYAMVLAVVFMIIGGGVAFKADNKFGYVIMIGAGVMIFWVLKLHGII